MLEWEYNKDPAGSGTFVAEWGDFLNGLTVTASDWVAPDNISKVSDGFTDFDTFIKIDGGVDDGDYVFVNTVTDSNGDEWPVSILLKVRAR